MLEDPWVQDVFMAEYGIAGYGFICGIYEIYAKACKENPGSWINVPLSTITRKLRLSSAKVQRMLNDCAAEGKLSFEISLRDVRIKIPKMAELTDEWTARKNKKLGSDSGETHPPKKNKNVITNVITEEEENTDRVCVNSDEVFSGPETEPSPLAANAQWHPLAEQGLSHLASLNSPNLQNLAWVKGYLTIKFGEYATNRQDLKPEQLLLCWLDTCDDAVSKNISTPGWFKKVFEAKVDKFSPSNPIKRANALPAAPIHERVMQAETVKYRLDGRYFTGSELKYTKPEGHLEPYYEVKSTGEKLVANFVAIERT